MNLKCIAGSYISTTERCTYILMNLYTYNTYNTTSNNTCIQ